MSVSRQPWAIVGGVIVAAAVVATRQGPPHHHPPAPVVEVTASVAAVPSSDQIVARPTIRIYATRLDGDRLVSWHVPIGASHDIESLAYLATVEALNGPPIGVHAVRFPPGTTPQSVRVRGGTVYVDLSPEVERTTAGGFAEAGEFKGLVWTLTALPGIEHVRLRVDGATLPTLPGGHFELDEPLSRADW